MSANEDQVAPAVSVIIPARDAAPTLARTLEALRRQDMQVPFEVLVVDDGSRDRTREIAARYEPWVSVISLGSSGGPGRARNQGVAAAHAPILAFTDSDCFPSSGWLAAGVRAIQRGADLVQGAVQPDQAAVRTPFDRTIVVRTDTGFYPTANLFVRRELFDALGGFTDWLLEHESHTGRVKRRPADRRRQRATRTPIGEDTLLAWRGRRHGAQVAFSLEAMVEHAVVPGRVWDEVLDRWHWARDMPGMVRIVPELRRAAFYRRWFFSAKTAHFDLAAASVLIAALGRSPLPLAGGLPYARWIAIESRRFPARDGVRHALGSVVSDGATLLGLLTGSVASRCPLF